MSRLDAINERSDHYCTRCYRVVRVGGSHREDEHGGRLDVEIVPIHATTDGEYIAKPRDMGHFTPHIWMEVDDHEMCGECGAIKVAPEDVPDGIVARADGGSSRTVDTGTDQEVTE